MPIPWKKIEIVSAVVLLAAFTGANGIATYYQETRPTLPSREGSHIVPYSIHNKTVYLTKGEDQLLTWLYWIAGVAAGSALTIHALIGRLEKTGR